MTFVSIQKEYPNYYAITDTGKQARITIDENKNISLFGISGKQLAINNHSYYNDLSGYPIMKLLLDIATEWSTSRKQALWDYFNYADACASLNIEPISRGGYNDLREDYKATVRDILTATQKHNTDEDRYDAICTAVQSAVYKRRGLSEEDAAFLAEHRGHLDTDLYFSSVKYRNLTQKYFRSPVGRVLGVYSMARYIGNYIEYCTKAELPIETGDLWANYIKAKETYEARRAEIEENTFRTSQTAYAIGYENDTFIAIVPLTHKECLAEGKALKNCLGGIEWNGYLSNGQRKVVFIRRKDNPDKPYIACDMSNNLNIQQYLTYCNASPREDDAKAFKAEYQHYLKSLL